MAESASSPRRINAAERRKQALQLRKAGVSYDEIARQLNFADRSGAQKAVMTELRALPKDDAKEVLELELQRLDRMVQAYWPGVLKGHVRSGEIVVRLMERRAKLMGLDADESIHANSATSAAAVDAWLRAMLGGTGGD